MQQVAPHSMRVFPTGLGADKYNISGIAERCDVVLLSDYGLPHTHIVGLEGNRNVKTVFVSLRAHLFALNAFFYTMLPRLTEPFVLITGSSDTTIPRQLDERREPISSSLEDEIRKLCGDDRLLHWFAENLDENFHEKVSPIPLGFVKSEGDALLNSRTPPPLPYFRSKKILCAHRVRDQRGFEARKRVSSYCDGAWNSLVSHFRHEITLEEFFAECRAHRFVLCVEGGGLDPCPKAFVALACGAIPIVKRTAASEALECFPIAFVDEWREESISNQLLETWNQTLLTHMEQGISDGSLKARLSLDYWWSKIEKVTHAGCAE